MQTAEKKATPPVLKILDLDFDGRQEHDDAVEFLAHHRGQGETDEQLRDRVERMADQAAEAPAEPEAGDDARPTIMISTEEHLVNEEAVRALAGDAGLYQRGGLLVRFVRDQSPATDGVRRPFGCRIDELPRPLLQERLAADARWLRVGKDGPTPDHPPGWCVSAVHARGEWEGIRHLEAVIDHPVLKPEGSLLDTPGYDPETALYYQPSGATPDVPERPTKDDAVAACEKLLGVVQDFPFASQTHRAAWVAALLTPLARFAFTGPSPLFLADANVRGAGKGLMLNAIAQIVTGAEFATATYTNDEAELRKRITSLALKGDRLVLLDNLAGKFGNAVLDAALTSTRWEDRVLGGNRMFRGPLYVTWYATGNNVALGADTARRVCHIRLDSPLERPELRNDFRQPRLLAWVRKQRAQLLGAALTLLRGFCAAGQPDMGLPAWGSFEGWSVLVRNAVVWCGLPDPGETRIQLQESSDAEATAMRMLLAAWEKMDTAGRGYTAARVVNVLYADPSLNPPDWRGEMKVAIETLTDCNDARRLARLLGYKLRTYQRRIFDGRFLDNVGEGSRAGVLWVVRSAKDFHDTSQSGV
jgi:hypothetical protein